jgi:hypothetical protein
LTGSAPDLRAAAAGEPIWRKLACFLLFLTAVQIGLARKIQISQWFMSGETNPCVAEGAAWLTGRLDIPMSGKDPLTGRLDDTALFKGKVYNIYPPLLTFLTIATSPVNKAYMGDPAIWQPMLMQLLLYAPLLILAFIVFSREVGDSAWGGLLAFAYLGGTAILVSLNHAREGEKCQVLHIASQSGLFLILWDVLGRRRIWPAMIGLMISTWSRQLTLSYAIPILWAAWDQQMSGRKSRIAMILVGLMIIVAPMLTINYLKFGNPLDTGYQYIFEGRQSGFLEDRFHAHGLFSWKFLPENLFYSYISWPAIDLQADGVHIAESNNIGTSIFLTSPLLIWVFISCRNWWDRKDRRALMIATLPIIAGHALYHGMGFPESGYFRFALDFIPVWMVVTAPWMLKPRIGPGSWRIWLSLACITWSVLYFNAITPDVSVSVEVARPIQ